MRLQGHQHIRVVMYRPVVFHDVNQLGVWISGPQASVGVYQLFDADQLRVQKRHLSGQRVEIAAIAPRRIAAVRTLCPGLCGRADHRVIRRHAGLSPQRVFVGEHEDGLPVRGHRLAQRCHDGSQLFQVLQVRTVYVFTSPFELDFAPLEDAPRRAIAALFEPTASLPNFLERPTTPGLLATFRRTRDEML